MTERFHTLASPDQLARDVAAAMAEAGPAGDDQADHAARIARVLWNRWTADPRKNHTA